MTAKFLQMKIKLIFLIISLFIFTLIIFLSQNKKQKPL